MVQLPQQHNLQDAADRAVLAVRAQPPEQLRWLGARPLAIESDGTAWVLRVLGDDLRVELSDGQVVGPDGKKVGPFWRILVLHYLAVASRPEAMAPEVAFAGLAPTRAYASTYDRRVTHRLCETAGRDVNSLRRASAALNALPVQAGDLAFDLKPLPRVVTRIVWYAGDEEFPPSATMLFPGNIQSFFCSEDIVVLSERIVSRLGGRPL